MSRWSRVLAIMAVPIAGACSDAATGPTAAGNAQLIAHFLTLSETSQLLQSGQLFKIVDLLKDGTPVGRGRISIGGKTSTYSMIAEYDVIDRNGEPADSLVTFLAWSGANADTIVQVDAGLDDIAILVTDSDSVHLDQTTAPITVTASKPGGRCLPPSGLRLPSDVTCQIETIMLPVTAQLNDQPLPFVDFAIPAEPITAIRMEFRNPAP